MSYLFKYKDGSIGFVLAIADEANLGEEIAKSGAVEAVEVDISQIPADRTFRGAWRHCPEHGVRHCMETARNIHRDRMREKRELYFKEINAEYMKRTLAGLSTEELGAKNKVLCDLPASPRIEQVQTIEELKELWPEELGETPYVEPVPPPPQPKPYATAADGRPLRTKAEYNAYMAQIEEAIRQQEEPEPAPPEEQADLEDFLAVPEPPLDLPRIYTRSAPGGNGNALTEAMRRADELIDAPLPEYVPPPPEPTAADVFAADVTEAYAKPPTEEPPQQPARKLLREAVTHARAVLSEDRSDYDIAVMALHGNNEQAANLDLTAKRLGVPMQDVADDIIANWRGCERALTAVRELNEIALAEMVKRPGESHAIVNEAIALINEQVGNATAYRN